MNLIQKDKGYAWIVLVSSSIVMFVGSSTYTGFGVLVASTEIENSLKIWILNILYSLWFGIALLAGPLATMYTQRKIVMFGFFMASIGLALSGVLITNPGWLILSYSVLVGLSVGIGVHESLLLVLCHFRRLRGLAVGILGFSSLLGQIATPLIYQSLPDVKDKFYIRSLLTAICFMASSFFISPSVEPIDELEFRLSQQESVEMKQRSKIRTFKRDNTSTSTMYNMNPGVGIIRNNTREDIQITNQHDEENQCYHSSQLANIPEEAEDLVSASSADTVRDNSSLVGIFGQEEEERKLAMIESHNISMSEGYVGNLKQQSCSTTIRPLDPELISKINQTIRHKRAKKKNDNNRSQFRYRIDSIFDPDIEFMQTVRKDGPIVKPTLLSEWKQALLHFDYNLLRNFKFINVIIGCNLGVLSLSMFPIVLTSFTLYNDFNANPMDIGQNISTNSSNNLSNTSDLNVNEAERLIHAQYLLNVIYVCDGIARVGVGYICNFSYVNKRAVFLVAMLVGSCAASSVRFIDSMVIIKIFTGLYGFSIGTMSTTEVLLLIDKFGMEKLPSSYGLLLGTRVLLNYLISPLMCNPISQFLYTIHPFSNSINPSEFTSNSSDPLGLFEHDARDINRSAQRKLEALFFWFGLPLLCAILWIIEILWIKLRSKLILRLKIIDETVPVSRIEEASSPFPYLGRPRSHSSPIV